MQRVLEPNESRKRGCLFYVKRGLKWFGIVLIALVLLGVAYQVIATEMDKRNFSPRGQLYTVNGHRMHMVCKGEGSPAVILEAGGSAESLWWYRVQNQLAKHTRVCAYDRPGHGWSEPTSEPRDALTVVRELHTLLAQAGVPAPYVMAGHSFGAVWARIFAAQYPAEVAGIVLVDSTFLIPREFASQSEFDQWKTSNDAIQVLPWAVFRFGLMRLTSPGAFQSAGYPPDIVPELVALRSPNQVFDADYAEQVATRWAFTEASADAESLGDLPMAVLWASQTYAIMENNPGLRGLPEALATYSTESVTRMVEGADHVSILGSEKYAQQVSDAILDVMEAAKSGKPMAQ
jgi:pimeloyl-ACP methyl ester carboxylesterase